MLPSLRRWGRGTSERSSDILIKQAIPIGASKTIAIEVKAKDAANGDLGQLLAYERELGRECIAALLIAKRFPRRVATRLKEDGVRCVSYDINWEGASDLSFEELLNRLSMEYEPPS